MNPGYHQLTLPLPSRPWRWSSGPAVRLPAMRWWGGCHPPWLGTSSFLRPQVCFIAVLDPNMLKSSYFGFFTSRRSETFDGLRWPTKELRRKVQAVRLRRIPGLSLSRKNGRYHEIPTCWTICWCGLYFFSQPEDCRPTNQTWPKLRVTQSYLFAEKIPGPLRFPIESQVLVVTPPFLALKSQVLEMFLLFFQQKKKHMLARKSLKHTSFKR